MVRKQGGLCNVSFAANENIVEKCLEKVKEIDPKSRADKLYHITIKADAYTEFTMDGFQFTTDELGNFSSIMLGGTNTAEIRDVRFIKPIQKCVICFVY